VKCGRRSLPGWAISGRPVRDGDTRRRSPVYRASVTSPSTTPTSIVIASVPAEVTPYGEPVTSHTRHLLAHALRAAGHLPADVVVRRRSDLAALAADYSDALVLNLCYGLRSAEGDVLEQPEMAAILEQLGMDTVGTRAAGQRRCQDKLRGAEVAAEVGIASPRTFTFDEAVGEPGPLVVKPRAGAAHRGVRLVTRGEELLAEPPASGMIVLEYVDGPEYSIGVIVDGDGVLHTLPAARIRYGRSAERPALYDWATTTVAPESSHRFGLAVAARALFGALGLRHYARFDFRVARGGRPVLLDANALPSLAPRPLRATSARWAGRPFPDLIAAIVDGAIGDRRPATASRRSAASVG
jgi:D-alanine-D-alanine ligase